MEIPGIMPGPDWPSEKGFSMVKNSARRTRRADDPGFNARVALAALRHDKTMSAVVSGVRGKRDANQRLKAPVARRCRQCVWRPAAEPAAGHGPLHARIGQLTLENNFLERAINKAGLLSAKR